MMKIHKPDDLALLYRVLRWQGRDVLSLGAIAGFRLDVPGNASLLSEAEIWQQASIACQDAPLDEGFPKPSGEFLLFGTAHAPGPQAVPHLPVSARVGDVEKKVIVFGTRHVTALGNLSAPSPFFAMPLTGEGATIPNVEDPGNRILSPSDTPPPAGLGPIATDAPERSRYLGRFDASWLAREWPHLPALTSAGYAHAARPDQHNVGFWRGDEAIELLHLRAGQPLLTSALPALRARCFVRRQVEASPHFEEISAHAETVWLLPDLGSGLVLYRAVATLGDEDGDDILDVVTAWEPMHSAPRPTAAYESMLFPSVPVMAQASTEPSEIIAPVPARSRPERTAAAAVSLPGITALEASVIALERDTETMLQNSGLTWADVERYLPQAQDEPTADLAALTKLVDDVEEHAQSMLAAHGMTPEKVASVLAALAPPPLPQSLPSAKSLAELIEQLESDVAAMQLSHGVRPEVLDKLIDSHPELAILRQPVATSPDALAAVELEAKTEGESRPRAAYDNSPPTPSPRPTAAATMARHTREAVVAAHAAGQRLAGMDLSGLDLSDLSLQDADLSEAALGGANLNGADLRGASLRHAHCEGTDFSGARLDGAHLEYGDFTDADFTAASMLAANCEAALFDRARMTSLRAAECHAPAASFADSVLAGADFARADLRGARFHRGVLDGASFADAECAKTEWYGAHAEGACFAKAQLQRSRADAQTVMRTADLSDAALDLANWEGVDLRHARLTRARLDGADLSGARADEASLAQASARGARLDKARLTHADLTQINLFGGSLRRARVSHAKFDSANLYGMDGYGANLGAASLDGAMTGRTVLAIPDRQETRNTNAGGSDA